MFSCQEELYAHIEQADMDKVEKALQEKSEWFDKKSNLASKQVPHQDPVVLSSDILSQRKVT